MAKKPAAKKPAAKAQSPVDAQDEDFVLHSLQEEFDKNRTFDADADQMMRFYEQMLLIRRFEERAGQLPPLYRAGSGRHRAPVGAR